MAKKPTDSDACPTRDELTDYAANALIGKRNEQVFLHLKYCARCLRRLAELKRPPSPDEIIRGSRPSWWQRLLGWRGSGHGRSR